jgi:hypothetical protein
MADTAARPTRVVDHRFFYGVGIAFSILVFAGFARTYYLKGFYGTPPLSLLVHIHGVVMTLCDRPDLLVQKK